MKTSSEKPPLMKKILLYSGWQTCNIGDIGHTPGTLRYLEEFVPEAKVTVCLHRSNDAILALLTKRFPRADFILGNAGIDGDPRLRRVFDEADLVMQNSGMHYNRFYNLQPVLPRDCMAHGKPYGLYGQSFDGFDPSQEGEMIGLLSAAAFVYCRDGRSLDYLRRLNVRSGVLEFGPDGCFGIDVRNDPPADLFLRENGLEPGRFITVTLRSNTPKLEAGHVDALNPPTISEADERQNGRWAARLREVICGWVRETGEKVLLAPEVDKEIGAARRLLLDPLPADVRDRVVSRDRLWNVDEAASVYARARVLVSMEPHSCIIGLANGTPALHYFSPKYGVKASMFDDIGLPEWLHEIETVPAATVLAELFRIRREPEAAREKAGEAMARVHRASWGMAATIRRTLRLAPIEECDLSHGTPLV